jgi:hypothetical protein
MTKLAEERRRLLETQKVRWRAFFWGWRFVPPRGVSAVQRLNQRAVVSDTAVSLRIC